MRIRVVGAALVRDGRTFAARRSATMSEPNRWEFPGGKVEPGESDEQALRRELREELGIEATIHEAVGSATVRRGAREIVLTVYRAELRDGEPSAVEHAETGFFEDSALGGLDWAEADVPIVAEWLARRR